ncbi:MAG TPA: isochorismatase family protein [Candidatus Limnocylindrales bacterium]
MRPLDRSTALVVVDVQNDFADPAGSLAVTGAAEVVRAANAAAAAVRAAGGLVAYTADWHPAHTPHFAQDGGIWPVHCVADGWGAAFHPDLVVDGPVVLKGTSGEDGYSGFTVRDPASGATAPTELAGLLRASVIKRVIVCGLATDYCVQATALDAVELGFATAVLVDGIRAVDLAPGDGQRALDTMAAAGVDLVAGELVADPGA